MRITDDEIAKLFEVSDEELALMEKLPRATLSPCGPACPACGDNSFTCDCADMEKSAK